MSVGWLCVAFIVPLLVGFVCIVVADAKGPDATPETWDNGRVTYKG